MSKTDRPTTRRVIDPIAEVNAPYTPEACERDTVRTMNRVAPKCAAGHAMTYSHAVGGFRCEYGALHRAGGAEATRCPKAPLPAGRVLRPAGEGRWLVLVNDRQVGEVTLSGRQYVAPNGCGFRDLKAAALETVRVAAGGWNYGASTYENTAAGR